MNENHDERGRFASGPSNESAMDHFKKALENIHRATGPSITRHADRQSVGTEPPMTPEERAQKIADWRDKGTSDVQVREGIRALFNLPSREGAELNEARRESERAQRSKVRP